MAITISQLSDPSVFSQLGPEYVCTTFMFDEGIMTKPAEVKESEESGFMSGISLAHAETVHHQETYGWSP